MNYGFRILGFRVSDLLGIIVIGTEYLFAPCPELLRKPARTLLQLASV
jgi:hypothetical protein